MACRRHDLARHLWLALPPGLFFVIVLAQLGVRFGAAMPQTAQGDGVLAVAFGDAKATISRAMVHKADSYFHGGVDMECTADHDSDCADGSCAHDHHDHAAESNNPNNSSWDPWSWINTHVRAPEVERHLEGARAVELMPWFWAAVKADPHNVDAWTTALYVSSRVMKDAALSRRVLVAAKNANPESLEILLAEGKLLYDRGQGDAVAARMVFTAVRDKALARCGNDPSKLAEPDLWAYRFACNYLDDIGRRHSLVPTGLGGSLVTPLGQ